MSYCRWSSDDFQCDVYCYEDCDGGFTTHVASNRPIVDGSLPPVVPLDAEHVTEWSERHKLVMQWIERAERKPIGLLHDGQRFHDATACEAAVRLQGLKNMGYLVPQYAIDALRHEQGE